MCRGVDSRVEHVMEVITQKTPKTYPYQQQVLEKVNSLASRSMEVICRNDLPKKRLVRLKGEG